MSGQRFTALLYKITRLQELIRREQKMRNPNWIKLLKLKKLRLVMKDRLQAIAKKSYGSQSQGTS